MRHDTLRLTITHRSCTAQQERAGVEGLQQRLRLLNDDSEPGFQLEHLRFGAWIQKGRRSRFGVGSQIQKRRLGPVFHVIRTATGTGTGTEVCFRGHAGETASNLRIQPPTVNDNQQTVAKLDLLNQRLAHQPSAAGAAHGCPVPHSGSSEEPFTHVNRGERADMGTWLSNRRRLGRRRFVILTNSSRRRQSIIIFIHLLPRYHGVVDEPSASDGGNGGGGGGGGKKV
mmetsp:Transcript_12256/g.21961  ORF Transcript_12256/g.21961 Transcript_12256/m.21961 type:complete len:228 (+) Transcript_12256:1354-2037(+)